MMTKTLQENNVVGGHLAGRDLNVYNISAPTSLGRLIKRYREEAEHDPHLLDYIKELKLFTNAVPDEKVSGLEAKLHAADRSDLAYEALQLKEMIYEDLKENISSPTFQHVYAYLMSLTMDRFVTYVRPALDRGASREEVDRITFVQIICPILKELETCGEIHNFTSRKIKGMMYFLAGNCHIRWH